ARDGHRVQPGALSFDVTEPTSQQLTDWTAVLKRFRGLRVVVIGDVVLDEHVVGRATRLSREAPVPVLELVERSWRPGAATNAATNVASLGGVPTMVGVIGEDLAGQRLCTELDRANVNATGL